MVESFDAERALDHIRHLSVDIGPRVMGTDADRQAGDYIRAYFEALGLRTIEQTFDVEGACIKSHRLEIIDPAMGTVSCHPILLTPGTPEQGVEGELFHVEAAEEPHIGPHLEHKIVLWSISGRMEYLTRYRDLAKHCPKAVIVIWPGFGTEPKHLLACESISAPYDRVTTFCISFEDGLALIRNGASKARVHLASEPHMTTSRNMIGELQGTGSPAEIAVIGGHYDTMPGVPGAIDNASGVGMVLELARLFARRGSSRTLRFVAWGGEEGGLIGSTEYIRRMRPEQNREPQEGIRPGQGDTADLGQHVLCLSLDGLGAALGQNLCYVQAGPDLRAAVSFLARERGVPLQVAEGFYGSDSETFAWAGVPALSFGRVGPTMGYVHTPLDTIELIDAAQVRHIGGMVELLLNRAVAEAVAWPFKRTVPAQLVKCVTQVLKEIGWVQSECPFC